MAYDEKIRTGELSLCPYVQRSVITMNHKKVPYAIRYIDLASPPDWFLAISPMGKVPLLEVKEGADTSVLFESAIINEFLDEVTPPALALTDPLKKAKERAWVELSSELNGKLYQAYSAKEKDKADAALEGAWKLLAWIEKQRTPGPFFRGQEFSLVDSAFAPFFMRFLLLSNLKNDPRWKEIPHTHQWAEHLLGLPEVKASVRPDFESEFRAHLKKQGSLFA